LREDQNQNIFKNGKLLELFAEKEFISNKAGANQIF